jgi:hypothetical protein
VRRVDMEVGRQSQLRRGRCLGGGRWHMGEAAQIKLLISNGL